MSELDVSKSLLQTEKRPLWKDYLRCDLANTVRFWFTILVFYGSMSLSFNN